MTCPSWCREPDCTLPYGRHLSFSVPASATPTRRGGAMAMRANHEEKARDKDLPAYKRLRAEGHQPPSTKGADRLEAIAQCDEHVSTGLTHADPSLKTYVQPRAFGAFNDTFGHKATEVA